MNASDFLIYSLDTDLAEKYVAAGCSDGAIRLYSLKDNQIDEMAQLEGHTGAVTKAVYANFGEIIVSADFIGKLIIWKAEDGKYAKCFEKQVADGPIYDIAVRYTESMIIIFCGVSDGKLITLQIDGSFKCEENEKEVHRLGIPCLSTNNDLLVTVGSDQTIAIHFNNEIDYLNQHKTEINCVAVGPSNVLRKKVFASGDKDGKVFIVRLKEEEEEGKFEIQEIELEGECHSLSWSKRGFVLTAAFGEGELKSYTLGETGIYEEIAMVEQTNE